MELDNKEKATEFDPSHFLESFMGVGKELILRPRLFFRQLPRKENLKNPLFFLVVCSFLSSLFMANLRNGDFKLFLLLLFANTFSAFIGSFVLHNIIVKIFHSDVPFGSTFRILSYAGIVDIISWIPVLGQIAYFYGLYLIFLGLQEIHNLKPKQAGAAILLIIIIITLLLLILVSISPEGLKESYKIMDPDNAGF